jgi:hypothetical protein
MVKETLIAGEEETTDGGRGEMNILVVGVIVMVRLVFFFFFKNTLFSSFYPPSSQLIPFLPSFSCSPIPTFTLSNLAHLDRYPDGPRGDYGRYNNDYDRGYGYGRDNREPYRDRFIR